MAYDLALAGRIRDALERRSDVTEKEMFGGIAFLRGSRMFCGIVGRDLMVRVGPARYEEALRAPHSRPMDFTGKPMKGYVYVAPEGCYTDAALAGWVAWGVDFVASMPPKESGPVHAAKASRSKRGVGRDHAPAKTRPTGRARSPRSRSE